VFTPCERLKRKLIVHQVTVINSGSLQVNYDPTCWKITSLWSCFIEYN